MVDHAVDKSRFQKHKHSTVENAYKFAVVACSINLLLAMFASITQRKDGMNLMRWLIHKHNTKPSMPMIQYQKCRHHQTKGIMIRYYKFAFGNAWCEIFLPLVAEGKSNPNSS